MRSGQGRAGDHAKTLDHSCDVFPGQANVAVPALPNVVDETVGDEHVNMLARRRPGQARVPAQFTNRPGPPVHERSTHGRPRRVSQSRRDCRDIRDRFRKHARNHASSVHPELFGDDRTIADVV